MTPGLICVLFTAKETEGKNIWKLGYVMGEDLPFNIRQETANTSADKHLK